MVGPLRSVKEPEVSQLAMLEQNAAILGTMDAKVTLRLPQRLLTRLTERSEEEGRSLNDTAVRTQERGLGEASTREGGRVLGPLLEVAPTEGYDPKQLRRKRAGLAADAQGLDEGLDWTRGGT